MNDGIGDGMGATVSYEPTLEELFPDLYEEGDGDGGIWARIAERWDLTGDLPTPKWDVTCPVCSARMSDRLIQGRLWSFHKRSAQSKNPHRCDVSFKCRTCSYVLMFGVVVPQEMYNRRAAHTAHSWREVHSILKKAQKFVHRDR